MTIKYGEIIDISLVIAVILIYRKNRYLKRRFDTIPILSISAIYHDIFRHVTNNNFVQCPCNSTVTVSL